MTRASQRYDNPFKLQLATTLLFILKIITILFEKDQDGGATPKSTRKRLMELGYPLIDEASEVIQAIKSYSKDVGEGFHNSSLVSLTQIRRILGYIQFITEAKDNYGWQLLLETDKMIEYVHLLKGTGASPSTAKNYCDRILTLMKLTESYFFDRPGMPQNPEEVSACEYHINY